MTSAAAGVSRTAGRTPDDGVTLVETIIVTFVLAIVGAVTSAALLNTHKEYRLTDDESQGLADVRVVVERLGRDVRQARSIDAGATTSKLVLWIDYNSDYIKDPVNQPDEIVTWQLQAQGGGSNQYNVLRQTTPTDVRVEARTLVSDISFKYFSDIETQLNASPSLAVTDAAAVTVVTADLRYNAIDGGATDRVTTFSQRLRNVR